MAEGFSRLPYFHHITETLKKECACSIKSSPERWTLGVENLDYLPSSVKVIGQGFLDSLNKECSQGFSWRMAKEDPLLIYGKGSTPVRRRSKPLYSHAIKVLIACNLSGSETSKSAQLKQCGQFVHNNQCDYLDPGMGVLYDNTDYHGWLCNTDWMFAVFPVAKKPKLTLIINPTVSKILK